MNEIDIKLKKGIQALFSSLVDEAERERDEDRMIVIPKGNPALETGSNRTRFISPESSKEKESKGTDGGSFFRSL